MGRCISGKAIAMPQNAPGPGARQAVGSTGNAIEFGLARQLGELAREMQAEPDMTSLLQRITETARNEIDGAEYVCISYVDGPLVTTRAVTDEKVRHIDERQSQLGEGPCLSSLREQITVRSDDFEKEQRWPSFVAATLRDGIRSMLSVQLFVDAESLGALNMYSTKPDAFADHDESIAMLLALHAAIAMQGSTRQSNLRTALESRDVIGQAKGILMERYKISAIEAFNLLIVASQRTHLKLRDIADALAATGDWIMP
jgi:GAF domain-containing protein